MSITVTRRSDGSVLVECGGDSLVLPAVVTAVQLADESELPPPPPIVTPPPTGQIAFLAPPGTEELFAGAGVSLTWVDARSLTNRLRHLHLGSEGVVRVSIPQDTKIDLAEVIAAAEPTGVRIVLGWDPKIL